MARTVFILGAGASADCGAPLMNNFLDRARDIFSSGRLSNTNAHEHFQKVFRAISSLQNVHSKAEFDIDNVESIFTSFELASVIRSFPGINDESSIDELSECLKSVIVTTLEESIQFKVASRKIVGPSSYMNMSKLLTKLKEFGNAEISIITFNYDIALDVALTRNDLEPHYWLGESVGDIDLLKLHGSVNWARSKDEAKTVIPLSIRELEGSIIWDLYASGQPTSLKIGTELKARFRRLGREVENNPVIVPPTWNKADYHRSLTRVWKRAAVALSEADSIYVMGYSLPLTDSFFKNLYALGSASPTMLRRFHVFDPSDAVDSRFKALLGPGARARYQFHPLRFNQAIAAISQDRTSSA
jgi:hypothetical protein